MKSIIKKMGEWETFFAWYPISIEKDGSIITIWLETVERRVKRYAGYSITEYRIPENSSV